MIKWDKESITERLFKKTPLRILLYLSKMKTIPNLMHYCWNAKVSYAQFSKYKDWLVSKDLVVAERRPNAVTLSLTDKGKRLGKALKKLMKVVDEIESD